MSGFVFERNKELFDENNKLRVDFEQAQTQLQ
jgi:hypothetical protein